MEDYSDHARGKVSTYFSCPASAEHRGCLLFLSLKSSQVLSLFSISYFFFSARKIQQWYEINHNVLYQPLGDITRKRAVVTRGLALWKNGSWCHKANSL